ncbi:MAG: thiamine pyrophosphate-dependent enzyme, partial [Pseudomonadota bacterium]
PFPSDAPRPKHTPPSQVTASGSDAALARKALADAKRPLAIVGLDVLRDGSHTVLRAFLEQFSIPFVTTYKAKGVLPEDHPLCLGGAGLSPLADRHLLPLISEADLVLCIGYDPIEMRTGWRDVVDPERQYVIDIAAVANTHYMHQATINIVGDTGETLEMLAQSQGVPPVWPGNQPENTRHALRSAFGEGDTWGPAAVIAQTRATLPQNTLATADSGAHRILLSQMWMCHEPRGLIQSSALCTMGCAVPMAMGLKIAEPDRPVISFSGDAGFLMVAGELATAAEMGLNPIFLVFVDASLALIELKQRQRQMTNRGVDFARHDFAAIGRAMGGEGVRVDNREALRDALTYALDCPRFTVIAAEIDGCAYDGRI